ncbi:Gamma-tubulin complex component 2 [Saguinus oedipus]|uniref:Gamma-tubulin complex component n=1 Tax=Saguinus oedipus TaxID=9490 RepID=A0ABQ9UQM2_SAGOE|nr:Gamma-tubulin complex component 2 [Saguinus oedipus]
MVEEHELRKERIQEDYNDKYWDQRYTIVQPQIPSFLQKMADKILSTGPPARNLHLSRWAPGARVSVSAGRRLHLSRALGCAWRRCQIEKAFNYASKVLLDFLMEEKELHLRAGDVLTPAPWRRSIKRYFLMDQGDFFVHFMDLTEEELRKPVEDITPSRLEALLELALRMSTANTDPFKDDLKVGFRPKAFRFL